MFAKLASLADRHARPVVALAAAFFVAAAVIGGGVADKLEPYGIDDPDTESVIAQKQLERAGFRDTSVIVLVDRDVSTSVGRARVSRITDRVQADPDVGEVDGFLNTGATDFVSTDGSKTYLAVTLEPTSDRAQQDAAERLADELTAGSPPDITVGGPTLTETQINDQTEEDLQLAEKIVFPLIFLLTFIFFRSLVAAALPVIVGALAVIGTFLLLWTAAEFRSVSIFALNMTTGLGLGLSIDYSLFVVSRYREEISKRGPGYDALKRTMETAGRTVLFSSLTVAAALAALMVFPQQFLKSMGMGGTLVALLAAVISLVVLPSVLALLGTRVNALAPRALQRRAEREATTVEGGFWHRLAGLVQRRPLPIATASVLVLIVLGLPLLGVRFTSVDAQILPPERSAREVDDVLRAEFPPFRDTPVRLVIDGGPAAVAGISERVGSAGGIVQVNPPRTAPDGTVVVDAIANSAYNTAEARRTVETIRALRDPPGATMLVTGAAAGFVDYRASIWEHLPLALAFVVLTTLLVLFLMTGSLVMPVVQLLMNFLNLCAVFGILVFVFQDARWEDPLGYVSQGALDQTAPMILFAMAFGLSTDYGVFLLARIKEARDGGADDFSAISIGLERTGRIVTAAALLFAVATAAFATSKMIFAKETFTGVALAVLLDASLIRALLVPSVMELLGHWSWWAPHPLRRLYWRFGVSEAPAEGSAGSP